MDMEGLSGICASLGILEEDETTNQMVYTEGEHCLDSLKDLLRFLRRDDPQTREVFKQVCRWNIVSKNLIPIIVYCQHDRNLVLNAVKILVFLSMPIEPSSSDIPQQIEYLWNMKFSLTSSDAVAVIVSLLEGPLENLEYEVFSEDDWKLVQLVVTLFRNFLAIQEFPLQQNAGQILSLRDRFLELLFRENVMELIIVITQQIGGYLRQDNLLLLETFHYIFISQDPQLISKAHLKGSQEGGDAKACIDGLKSIMEEEAKKKRDSRLQHTGRHSQFSGTFTRLTMDGSTAVYKGKPVSASPNALHKSHKGHGISTQNIVSGQGQLPSTRSNILELLHDFLNQFISGGYNVLMKSIHEDIEKEHHAIQKGDIIVFFKVAEFVTSFQYHKFLTSKLPLENTSDASAEKCADSTFFKGDICGPIAASMDESMFQLVISRWHEAFEGLKETNDYKFLSAASSLMKNMIRMLDLVLNVYPEDSKEPRTARVLLYKLFYDQTDQGMTQFLLNLIKTFNSHKQPKSDLVDLVEMMHVIMQLMENLQAHGSLRVSRRLRKGRKKKAVSDNVTKSEQFGDHAAAPDEVGTSVCTKPAEFKSEKESPVKGTSDGIEDTSTPLLVDELGTFETEMACPPGYLPQVNNNRSSQADDDLCCSVDDSSDDEQPPSVNEVDFKVSTLISAFANCSIIQNLCWLLKFYRSNSINTNHYIIGMLRKITDDLELAPMLYQLSLLPMFCDILVEQKSCPSEDYKEVVGFISGLVRKMLKKLKTQPLLFIEILFWKTRRECHCINAEYLLHELGHWKKGVRNLESIAGNGEVGSSQPSEWVGRSIADALGEDEADVVISHELGHQSGENSLENESGKTYKRKRKLVLNDEMETKLKELYEKFKDYPNCSGLIAESLDPDGGILPAQVSNKLKQLGLKVAPKKRIRAGGRTSTDGSDQQKDESTLHDSNDLEGTSQRQPLNTRKRVRAFSKDQEAMIKDLFEQFKDHRRCSYMIANALDADNMFTAAQVSRKLKQLGLHVPQQKRFEDNSHLRDEELSDLSAHETHASDNETLLSFRNSGNKDKERSFNREFAEQNVEGKISHDTDDEPLSSILKSRNKDKHRLLNQEFAEQNVEGKTSDDTDDEPLGSILRKNNKLPLKSKNEMLATITRRERIDKTSGIVVANDVTERRQGTLEAFNMSHAATKTIEGELPHLQADDELADSGDDVEPGLFVESTINRRKLRMVIDPEDDE